MATGGPGQGLTQALVAAYLVLRVVSLVVLLLEVETSVDRAAPVRGGGCQGTAGGKFLFEIVGNVVE